jgi:hypothetical protein
MMPTWSQIMIIRNASVYLGVPELNLGNAVEHGGDSAIDWRTIITNIDM